MKRSFAVSLRFRRGAAYVVHLSIARLTVVFFSALKALP